MKSSEFFSLLSEVRSEAASAEKMEGEEGGWRRGSGGAFRGAGEGSDSEVGGHAEGLLRCDCRASVRFRWSGAGPERYPLTGARLALMLPRAPGLQENTLIAPFLVSLVTQDG